ncbi:DUF1604-domain-containing protein [Sporormia fimetaria CBS 119925]|uniref:DUF1604-domain-containing protein n=1 Tax=Sporormia fimetaria CBS 119925 TaxID=1340428 RepID=A0A6A6V6L7_9PLEO|nr:DUF1604-domain-containing protein [Sporormia fimetaria CBS 119925]
MAFKRPRPVSPPASQKRFRAGAPGRNILLGTPLPDEDSDDGAFVPVWKQTVTDERGRRRLHGAFTGGFSAGYFNTVGSKEGWTPKAFVSSRSNRKKDQDHAAAQKPEDFMDEEDLADAAESRRLETVQDFAAVGGSGNGSAQDDPFGLFLTEHDTIGVKILQKMGWRRGQGLGRRVHRQARLDESGVDADPQAARGHLFAPEDIPSMPIIQQEHRRGLGYRSEARLGKDDDETRLDREPTLHFLEAPSKAAPRKQPSLKKTSIGVGVLNDTGSDDEDPYELGPKITFNRSIGKEKKAKKPSKFAKVGAGEKVVYKKPVHKTSLVVALAPRDGRGPLSGFIFATTTSMPSAQKFPPPDVPPGWTSSKGVRTADGQPAALSVADAAKSSALDAAARASILGEKQLPGKSVFDYMSKEGRDRIAALTGNSRLPQGLGQAPPPGEKSDGAKSLWTFVPNLDKDVAAAALAKGATGWMPYGEDLEKRARYVAFMELKTGTRTGLPERAPGVSVSDWVKELEEFAHAAQVFKPTSGIMASRFTSASSSANSAQKDAKDGTDLLRTATAKPEDPAEQAARLGMYGPMTRSQFPFHPSRLLCKRFNIAPPAHVPFASDADTGAETRTQEAVSKPVMDELMHEFLTKGPTTQRPAWIEQGTAASAAVPVTEHATVDVEHNEALSKQRAPEEVFKAIFGDSDDDD